MSLHPGFYPGTPHVCFFVILGYLPGYYTRFLLPILRTPVGVSDAPQAYSLIKTHPFKTPLSPGASQNFKSKKKRDRPITQDATHRMQCPCPDSPDSWNNTPIPPPLCLEKDARSIVKWLRRTRNNGTPPLPYDEFRRRFPPNPEGSRSQTTKILALETSGRDTFP